MAYLDAAAAAPIHPVARQALLAALDDGWADPAKLYTAGRRARLLLDSARAAVADVLGARPDEITFTASGTQALHAAVLGTVASNARNGRVLVHSAVEHSAVLHAAELASPGAARSVPVDHHGAVDPAQFRDAAAQPGVAAAALQIANHEVGTIQPAVDLPVPRIADATQALGHVPIDPSTWDVLAADARTWGGGPVGILAVKTRTRWRSPFPDDEAERGRFPGVPNVASIVAAAAALRAVTRDLDAERRRLTKLVDKIRASVDRNVPDVEVLGDPVRRLPHIVTFSCLYVEGEALLTALDKRGFAVSSGSSCTSSTLEPSHVLVAMGALTSGNVRVSLHHASTEDEVDAFLSVLPDVVAEVRAEIGATGL